LFYAAQGSDVELDDPWTGSTWGSSSSVGSFNSSPVWAVAHQCPTRSETALTTIDSGGKVYLLIETGSTWSAATELSSNGGEGDNRCFDCAYSQSSGQLLAVTRNASDKLVHFYTYNGTSVSAGSTLAFTGAGTVYYMHLVPKPGSNEIMLMMLDNAENVFAAVWNGSTWTNAIELETNAKTDQDECFSAAYETLTGRAIVAWSNATSGVKYAIWNGSAWSATSSGPATSSPPVWVKMASDPTSNQIIMGTLSTNNYIYFDTWNGSAWGTPLLAETNAAGGTGKRNFDVSFKPTGTTGLVAWAEGGVNGFMYRTWSGSAWSAAATGPALDHPPSIVQLTPSAANSNIFAAFLSQTSGRLSAMTWTGSSFGATVDIVTNAAGPTSDESFMVAPAVGAGSGSGGYTVCRLEQP
jgi:hypothetical protein